MDYGETLLLLGGREPCGLYAPEYPVPDGHCPGGIFGRQADDEQEEERMKVVYASDGQAPVLFYTSFKTVIGLVHVVWGTRGLLLVSFPDTVERSFLKGVGERFGVVPIKGEIPPGGTKGLLER